MIAVVSSASFRVSIFLHDHERASSIGLQILVQGRIWDEECVATSCLGSQNKYTLSWMRPALVAAFNAIGICSWPTKTSLASEFRSWYSNSIIGQKMDDDY